MVRTAGEAITCAVAESLPRPICVQSGSGMTISSSPRPSGRGTSARGAGASTTAKLSSGRSKGPCTARRRSTAGICAPGPGVQSPPASTACRSRTGRPATEAPVPSRASSARTSGESKRSAAWRAAESAPALCQPAIPKSAAGASTVGAPSGAGTTGAERYVARASDKSGPTCISPPFGNGIESRRRATCPPDPGENATGPAGEALRRRGSPAGSTRPSPESTASGAGVSETSGSLYPPALAVRSSASCSAASAVAGSAPDLAARGRRPSRGGGPGSAPDGTAPPRAAPSSTAPSRIGACSPLITSVPSGARKATIGSPCTRICPGACARPLARSTLAARSGEAPCSPICNAQSAHGSPVTCPSWSGWPEEAASCSPDGASTPGVSRAEPGSTRATKRRSRSLGAKAPSGWIQ